MKERPILFSGEMVRAILDGRKTQTRRSMKPQPTLGPSGRMDWGDALTGKPFWHNWHESYNVDLPDGVLARCQYGKMGDRLWVRETHYLGPVNAWAAEKRINPADPDEACYYRADWDRCEPSPWRPSIHMPRWASRITLEITDIRVQRLSEISEDDAQAEGVELLPCTYVGKCNSNRCPRHGVPDPYRTAFRALWKSIYKEDPWDPETAPYVWVVEFRRVEA